MSFMKSWRSTFHSKFCTQGTRSQKVISDWKIQVSFSFMFLWTARFKEWTDAYRRTAIYILQGKLINLIFVSYCSDPESSRHINSTIKTNGAIAWSEKTILIGYDAAVQQQSWKSTHRTANVGVAGMAHRNGLHPSQEQWRAKNIGYGLFFVQVSLWQF